MNNTNKHEYVYFCVKQYIIEDKERGMYKIGLVLFNNEENLFNKR